VKSDIADLENRDPNVIQKAKSFSGNMKALEEAISASESVRYYYIRTYSNQRAHICYEL